MNRSGAERSDTSVVPGVHIEFPFISVLAFEFGICDQLCSRTRGSQGVSRAGFLCLALCSCDVDIHCTLS